MATFEHGPVSIYYEESGSGDPVLLLPGWSMSINGFSALRAALLAGGYRVIAADVPGSGRSQPQPRDYTASYFDDDARLFADFLKQVGAAPAHVVGFSDGGEYALLMAEQSPEVVRTVVTWGAGGLLNDPTGQLRQLMFNMVDHPIPPMQGFRDMLFASYGEANARAMAQSEANAIGAIIDSRGGDLSLSRAGEIACPVLLMTGEHDMFVPPALLTELAGRIQTVETHIVAGAGHDVHNAQPEWTAETILAWFKKYPGALGQAMPAAASSATAA